jgi:hypothetical protein
MYPCLSKLVRTLFRLHNGTQYDKYVRPESKWVWPANAPALEKLAATLTEEDQEALVVGSETVDPETFAEQRGLQPLNEFLCDVFDGPLNSGFEK